MLALVITMMLIQIILMIPILSKLISKNVRSVKINDTDNMYFNINDGYGDNDNAVYVTTVNYAKKIGNVKIKDINSINDTNTK